MNTRLNISAKEEELELLRSVVPPRKMSRFIMDAATEKARKIRREQLRTGIVEAYEAEPTYLKDVGKEWEAVSIEGWPEY